MLVQVIVKTPEDIGPLYFDIIGSSLPDIRRLLAAMVTYLAAMVTYWISEKILM